MSKPRRIFYLVFLAFLQILQIFTYADGQDIEATIKIDPADPAIVAIDVKKSSVMGKRNLSFVTSAAGIAVPGDRITNLKLFDSKGDPVSYKRFISGEYVSDADFEQFSYRINIAASKDPASAAHASWLMNGSGILMLNDLFPQAFTVEGETISIKLDAPNGWSARLLVSPQDLVLRTGDGTSVIPVGKNWRDRKIPIEKFDLMLSISGDWNFKDEEAAEMASDIFVKFRDRFGSPPSDKALITIAKFPSKAGVGTWEAETRGQNVTIISSDMPFKTQSLQRLHEQLRHEMFHLWLPNGVKLKGNYDWFYEGFALYESLKLGVSLNRIRFDDFLDTLSRAHSFDNALKQRRSLIEASKNRWSGANTQVYARGMLVAFMCDVAALEASKGKRSVENISREIIEKYRNPNAEADGNEAVLSVLRSNKELLPIIEKYINGAEDIDLLMVSRFAGIENSGDNLRTNLKVAEKPSGRQKALLDKLGYNNWRKLSVNSK